MRKSVHTNPEWKDNGPYQGEVQARHFRDGLKPVNFCSHHGTKPLLRRLDEHWKVNGKPQFSERIRFIMFWTKELKGTTSNLVVDKSPACCERNEEGDFF